MEKKKINALFLSSFLNMDILLDISFIIFKIDILNIDTMM